ncbi:cyclic peptide export ABC transporter [Pseudoalteromonas maricaloris]|uniref:cyclic peptide export ABC transporter n=1 Tax=Pseudoalteromonas maricaloris TaxID=184924 RepID=UPI003C29244B
MNLVDTLIQKAPNKVFLSILLGILSGVSYSLLIPLISTSLQQDQGLFEPQSISVQTFFGFEIANYPFAKLFLIICLFILVTKSCSQIILTRVGLEVTSDLRKKVYGIISDTSISTLEKVGPARLIAALTTDVPRISFGARAIPELLINIITLFGMLSFLLYLNTDVFWFVIKCIIFGAITHQVPMFIGDRYFKRSREYMDQLHQSINGLIYGAKELKLNQEKRKAFYEQILSEQERAILEADKAGHTYVRGAISYGGLISFFVIGAVSFIFVNYHAITDAELISVVMVLLYITGPIGNILNFMPQLAVARTSLKKVNRLFSHLPPENINKDTLISFGDWSTISFKQVAYKYDNSTSGFNIGPLDFELSRGQITFIIGGNGSGKSTLSKIITQHYLPKSGEVYIDDKRIDQDSVESARQCFVAIYSDYYLFDRLHGVFDSSLKEKVDNYLAALSLKDKVTFENGKFSTLTLSDGQRRRLALLVAYVEDKDCYLFDEWAADQDPVFKDIFYNKILQDLKQKGKAVVVITHDDRYFEVADKLIVMKQGILHQGNKSNKDISDFYKSNEDGEKLAGVAGVGT